jgi:uncharacterized membrane protein
MVPEDIRQFKTIHLVYLIGSFSIALATLQIEIQWGTGLVILVAAFWSSMIMFFLSDVVEGDKPIDSRGLFSHALNLLGIICLIGTFICGLVWILAGIAMFLKFIE